MSAGLLALLCSGVAWASLPKPHDLRADERLQWQALGIAPLANGGASGLRMDATLAVEAIDVVPVRKAQPLPTALAQPMPTPLPTGPLRISGRVGDGLYWSLRAAGASPQAAAQYLAALATGMINAFKYGAPPHGGSAPGIDRIVMLLADEPNIREVILFPMNQKAEDLMMNAPAAVMPKQLKELHIKLVDPS